MQTEWRDLTYLLHGTARQQAAYHALDALQVCHYLRDFDPVLVGTIPLDIDIPESDLDIVCYAPDLDAFAQCLRDNFGHYPAFTWRRKTLNDIPSAMARFDAQGFPIEIVGQPLPVAAQQAFCHMVVEACLLRYGGEAVRQKIRQLKLQGVKTEPAFAAVFALAGEPYYTLFQLSSLSQEQLVAVITQHSRTYMAEAGH